MSALLDRVPLSESKRRLLRILGYALFGFLSFLITLYASLPRDRLRERLERELSQDPSPSAPLATALAGLGLGGMDVTIGDLGLSLLSPGIRFSDVVMKQRVFDGGLGGDGHKPTTLFLDFLDVHVPFWNVPGLLIGRRVVVVSAQAFGGQADAEVGMTGKEAFGKVRMADLVIPRLPWVAKAVPIPVLGTIGFSADVTVPIEPSTGRMTITGAKGLAEVSVADCVLGDGKAKLVVPGDPFLSQGLTFPKVQLGKVSGKVVVDKGRATIDQLHTKSADGEATLEGYVELREPIFLSELHLYLRFRPSPALAQREPTIELMTNAMAMGKRADGFLGFSIQGTYGAPRALPAKEPPSGVTVRTGALGMAPPAPAPLAERPMAHSTHTNPSHAPLAAPIATPAPVSPAPIEPPPASARIAPAPAINEPAVAPSGLQNGQNYRTLMGAVDTATRVAAPPPAAAEPPPAEPHHPAPDTVDPSVNLPAAYPTSQKGE